MASHCALLCLVVAFAFVSRASGALECNAVVAQVDDFDIDNVRSSPSDSVHMVVTDSAEEAGSTALCHVACSNYIMDASNGEGNNPNGSMEDSGMNSTMPEGGSENMTDTLLPMEPLDLGMMLYNCAQVKKYLDCRTGCIAQSKGLANCPATCSGRCESDDLCGSSLGCFGFDGNRCGVGCVRDDCGGGCQQFSQFSNGTLPRPTDPPQLTRLNNQELYDVSIPSELVLEGKPSLVYRIETQPGEYVYQWKVDIMYDLPRVVVTEFLLDLSAFVGRSVDVSFAYATEAGLSAYSDPTEMRLFNEVVPVSPSDSVHRIVTDSQDKSEYVAFCHVTCLPDTTNSGNSSGMENEMGNETIPCSSETGMGDTCNPSFSCAQVKKYLDCRTGCIAQSMGQADCAATCSGRCESDDLCRSSLGCFGFDGNRCGVGCEREDCSTGCQKGSQLTSGRLMAPMTPPQLERMPQNIYDVIIPSDSEIEIFSTSSPVFRIATETGEVYYQWMVDIVFELPDVSIMEYQLDLSAYTGQRLNISYAFATDVGISEYSQNAVVQVPEQCVVVELTTDQVLVKSRRDERAGFFIHSVLDVSWCPTPCVEGVSHYIITRNPEGGRCGRTVTETVNASTSNVLLMSNSPTRLPLPCTQTVQIQTVLIDGSVQEVIRTIRLIKLSGDASIPYVKNLSCPIEFDPESELYRVDFEFLVPFSPAALSHIEALVIRVDVLKRLRDSANPFSIVQVGLVTDPMEANVDQTVYRYTIFLEPQDIDIYYQMSVEVNWMSPPGPARSDNCPTMDATAPPPFPVQNITILDTGILSVARGRSMQRVETSVLLEWEKPQRQLTRVPIMKYEIYVGDIALEGTESGSNLVPIENMELTGTGVGNIVVALPVRVFTANVQVRSYQYTGIPSNWSEAEQVTIVILETPIAVENLQIILDSVAVRYDRNQPELLLMGNATWDKVEKDADIKFEQYIFEVQDQTFTNFKTPYRELDDVTDLSIPDNLMLDAVFSVTYTVSFMDTFRDSIESKITKSFRALAYPENINVTVTNPRLIRDEPGHTLSMELSILWEHPQTEEGISSYDIYLNANGQSLRDFDLFGESDGVLQSPGSSTQFSDPSTNIDVTVTDTVNPSPLKLMVQMRSIKNDSLDLLPQWSGPIVMSLDTLQPPVINSSDLLSINLTRQRGSELFSVSTDVMLSWEDEGEAESYEVWVGSRPLEAFGAPDDVYGSIYQVDPNSAETGSAPSNTTNINSTTVADTLITQIVSATFNSDSNQSIVHVQIRGVDPYRIPIWSTPAVSFLAQPVPPPVDIEVAVTGSTVDSDRNIVTVTAAVEWALPPTQEDGDREGEGEGDVTDGPEPLPEASSTVPTGSLVATPTPTPIGGISARRRRQSDGDESQSGSGTGSGDDDQQSLPPAERTAVLVYMGRDELDTFAPQPDNVMRFEEVTAGNGNVEMTYSFEDDEFDLKLYVQLQFEAKSGVPQWSKAEEVTVNFREPEIGGARSNNESDVTLPVTLGVVCAFVVGLLIAIIAVIVCIVRNKQKYKIINDGGEDALEIYARPGLTGIYSGKGPILDEWEISTEDVIVDELLGEGAFGEVYKGVIRGPLENPKISAVLRQAIGVPVAIKLLKYSSAGKEKADFLAEIDMMKKIAEGYNTHIVNMVGCVTLQEPLCLITEFVPYGDLLSYLKYQRRKRSDVRRKEKLQQHQTTDPADDGYELEEIFKPAPYMEPSNAYSHLEPKKDEPEPEPTEGSDRYKDVGDIETDDLIRFAYQIASGMEYLASLKIVHRDLACRNVLLAKDKLLKITDFGLSREVQEVYVKKTRGRLPLKWMAIESITAREFTTASDVWGFGVVLYEIGTIGGFPYPSINNEDLLRMLTQGYRLEKPDNCSAEVYDLMLHCWQEEPEERPSFSMLRSNFGDMLQAGSDVAYIDLQVDEKAPYYQIKDDETRERRDSASSDSSEGSVSSIDKQKKKKLKRKRTNPYVPAPEQPQGQGQGQGQGEDDYIAMMSAGTAIERPAQLGIPISQLLPSSSSATQNQERELTPVDNAHTPLDSRTTNPYVVEPSEASLVAASLVDGSNGVHGGAARESSLGPNGLTESTHL